MASGVRTLVCCGIAVLLAAACGTGREGAPAIGVVRHELATPTGSFPVPFLGSRATLLSDGRVVLAGGTANNAVVNSAALFDPGTNQWTSTGNLKVARTEQTAVRLSDGRVLVSGGQDGSSSLASVEIFDPATGTFTL